MWQGRPLTGVVVDSGAAMTHVVPVVDGYVLGSSIQSIPVAGDHATLYLQQLLRCVLRGEEQNASSGLVVDDYVLGSSIRSILIVNDHATLYLQQLLWCV